MAQACSYFCKAPLRIRQENAGQLCVGQSRIHPNFSFPQANIVIIGEYEVQPLEEIKDTRNFTAIFAKPINRIALSADRVDTNMSFIRIRMGNS